MYTRTSLSLSRSDARVPPFSVLNGSTSSCQLTPLAMAMKRLSMVSTGPRTARLPGSARGVFVSQETWIGQTCRATGPAGCLEQVQSSLGSIPHL